MAAKKSIVTKVTDKVADLYESAKEMVTRDRKPAKKAAAKKTPIAKTLANKASTTKTTVKKAAKRAPPRKKAK